MMDFKWIDSKVDCYSEDPLLQKGCFEFYTSFRYNGEEFRLGEFALFKENNKVNSTRICKLLCVFQSFEGAIKHNGFVRCYSWARNVKRKFNSVGIKFDEENEIVEEVTGSDAIVSLKDIKKKCNVIFATQDEPAYLIKKYKLNPDLYFSCRYKINNDQLLPKFSDENADDIDCLVSSDLHELDTNLSVIGSKSPNTNSFTKTTPIKSSPHQSATYNKRKANHVDAKIILDSEGSEAEIEKVKSPSNPSKNLKLTPKSDEKKLNGAYLSPLKRNLSVKRVLNDSFDDNLTSLSGIPIFSYSIVNSLQNDPKQLKMKLKLTENQPGVKLKVFPTKLDDEIIRAKSPMKINDILEINNHVEFSPKAKAKLSKTSCDIDSPRQTRSIVESPYTSAQIGSTRRRSSRSMPRQSYAEYFSLEHDTPKKRVRRGSTDTLQTPIKEINDKKIALGKIDEGEEAKKDRNDGKNIDNKDSSGGSNKEIASRTKHKILQQIQKENEKVPITPPPRAKRSVGPPERYRSSSINMENSTPKQNHSNNDDSAKSARITRSVGRPKDNNGSNNNDKNANSVKVKQNRGRPRKKSINTDTSDDSDSEDDSKKNNDNLKSRLTRSVGRPKKYDDNDYKSTPTRLKNNVGRPKKYAESSESDTNDKTNKKAQSQIKNSKTPYNTRKTSTDDIRKSILKNSCKKLKYAESDDDDPQTPKKQKQTSTPKSNMKDTPTARARMIREGIITPSVQARIKAVVKDNTPLSKARTQLHVSFVPKSLPCREKEFADIINFLEGKLLDGCGGCMYVSGVPGTGKTATVTEVIRSLQKSVDTGDLPSFTYVNVNGMRLSEPRQSYVEIARQLLGKTVHWEQAQTMLENRFVKSQKKAAPIILVVDELDILCTKRQDVVYNLLDWPTKANAQLIVITIANTMDLPERLLMGRVTSRLGLTRLTFQAYTHKQLQEIVSKRLAGISAFNPDAIQLVARKVASVSGDARRALDICRRAVEIAELEGKHALVSMIHVNQALNAMITQPKVQAIKRCSRLEKLLLQAVVAEVERTGVEETNFSSILTMLVPIAALDGFQMVSSTIAMAAISKLGACRLLLTDQKHNNIYQRIILNVSADDVYYALTKTDL